MSCPTAGAGTGAAAAGRREERKEKKIRYAADMWVLRVL
jgi:hypothetical protein